MKDLKKPLIFALVLLPIALVGGWFTALYQFDLIDPAIMEEAVSQIGSELLLLLITAIQTAGYALVCGFVGYILAQKTGLMKPFRIEKRPLLCTLLVSVLMGALLSLDYWTFGAAEPLIRESTQAGLTVHAFVASILYGGIIEEVMMRLFFLSLVAFVLWWIAKKSAKSPEEVGAVPSNRILLIANLLAALLFAAGHLPATFVTFDSVTPLLLFRCFLFNGGMGFVFGEIDRRYGIGYSMLSHAVVHVVSKIVWILFI